MVEQMAFSLPQLCLLSVYISLCLFFSVCNSVSLHILLYLYHCFKGQLVLVFILIYNIHSKGSRKKVIFLVARPLRPYSPLSSLLATFFRFFVKLQKRSFFFVTRLPPLPS